MWTFSVGAEPATISDSPAGASSARSASSPTTRVLEDELRAVFVLRDGVRDGEVLVARRALRIGGIVGRRPRRKTQGALEEVEQARAAGIDDAGFAQHGQLLGRPFDRASGGGHDRAQQTRDVNVQRRRLRRRFGRGGPYRDHRPLDRMLQRRPCRAHRFAQCGREFVRPGRRTVADRARESTQHLREDHPRVPARPEQAPRGRRGGGRPQRVPPPPDDLGQGGARGQVHVRTGVAVGDRKDIEVVERAPILLQKVGARREESFERPPVKRGHSHGSVA